MNRLLKAEWYKMRNTKGMTKFFIMGCLILGFFPLINYILVCDSFSGVTTVVGWKLMSYFGVMFIGVFAPSMIGGYIGRGFKNKTFYYEIMEGHTRSNIIFSRIITCVSAMVIGLMVSIALYLTMLTAINGDGGGIDNFGIRIFLLIIIIVHIATMSVLLCMIFRSGILSGVTAYLRIVVFDMFIIMLLKEFIQDLPEYVSYWFLSGQWIGVIGEEISAGMMAGVIVSFIIENAILYVIALRCMKKNEYK